MVIFDPNIFDNKIFDIGAPDPPPTITPELAGGGRGYGKQVSSPYYIARPAKVRLRLTTITDIIHAIEEELKGRTEIIRLVWYKQKAWTTITHMVRVKPTAKTQIIHPIDKTIVCTSPILHKIKKKLIAKTEIDVDYRDRLRLSRLGRMLDKLDE